MRTMRWGSALLLAMLLICPSVHAKCADDPIGAIGTLLVAPIGYLANLIPASGGVDVDVRSANPARAVRGVIGWPIQIPFGGSGWQSIVPPCDAIHRIVFASELTIGRETGEVSAGFEVRAGYRVVFHPKQGWFGLLVGGGTTFELAPLVRAPALSPEIGLHLGRPNGYGFLTGIVRADFFFDGDRAIRIGAAIGGTWL